jgi:putative effector of murein hydrolase LrgA (UPF0299 family)
VLLQFAGEVIARAIGLPLPGPVIGLLLLFGGLVVRGRRGRAVDPGLRATAQGLLSNLSLLFVPAGVGVMTQLGVLGANLLPIAVALLVSTLLGLFVTGWVMQRLSVEDSGDE